MKTLAVFACGLICAAFALQVPPSVIRVKRGSADDVVRVVEWMTDSQSGGYNWADRFRTDANCRNCPMLHRAVFNGWPQSCDPCAQPFLSQVKSIPVCNDCYQNQKNCPYCQQEIKRRAQSGQGYRSGQANEYLRKIFVY